MESVRAAVGNEFPVLLKLGSFDGKEGGLTLKESLKLRIWLERWGLDAIEISGGIGAGNSPKGMKAGDDEAPFLNQARVFTRALSIPVITVNGYRSLAVMGKALQDGDADLIAMSRPLIREPGLAAALEAGEKETADCLSRNRCLKIADAGLACLAK
ncbi:MAG: oxidoreductase [Planctomycetota bacterium]